MKKNRLVYFKLCGERESVDEDACWDWKTESQSTLPEI